MTKEASVMGRTKQTNKIVVADLALTQLSPTEKAIQHLQSMADPENVCPISHTQSLDIEVPVQIVVIQGKKEKKEKKEKTK